MDTAITIALIGLAASIIGGLLVAVVNHLFTRKKTEAETRKLEAEIEKLKAETDKIRGETRHELSEAKYYDSAKANEIVLYDGRKDFHSNDITSSWSDYSIQEDVVIIHDDDASLYLRTYIYKGKEITFIPKNELISGYRKLRASCDFKVISATYKASVYLWEEPESEETDNSVDDRQITVDNNEWVTSDFYFRAPPHKSYIVGILVERNSGKGSLQFKNLVVAERID